jgi:protein O-GlcNAc transferase
MADLDCSSPEQYITKAVVLASTPPALTAVKKRLAEAKRVNDFFDTGNFVRKLEAAMLQTWERHKAGLPPADIRVPELSRPKQASPITKYDNH